MSLVDSAFKEVLNIQDPKFDVEHLENYHLGLIVSDRQLKCVVLDPRKNRVVWFDHYIWGPDTDRFEAIDRVYDEHSILSAGFWKKITVLFDNSFCTIVPSHFFSSSNIQEVLSINFDFLDSDFNARSVKHGALGVHSVFGAEASVEDFFSKKYVNKKLSFHHSTNGILELSAGLFGKSKSDGGLWANWSNGSLLLIGIRKGVLDFWNQMECHYEEELLYFLQVVSSKQKWNVDTLNLTLSGEFNGNENSLAQLRKYFPKAVFCERPKQIYFPHTFDELPEHQHIEAFSFIFVK